MRSWLTVGLLGCVLAGGLGPVFAGEAGAAENGAAARDGAAELDVNARHLLIAYAGALDSSAVRTQDEARTLATRLAKELAADPAEFETYVRQWSDSSSKVRGGEVGPFRRGRMTPAFAQATFELAAGQVTAVPVETPYGFHIIQRLAVPAVYFGRIIVIAWDTVKKPVGRPLRSEKEARDLAVKLYTELVQHPERFRELQMRESDDPQKVQGGYLPDFYPGRADAALVEAVSGVAVNAVTAPLKTDYGYLLVQRLELLRNRPPLKGFVSARHLLIGYLGANDSTATRNWRDARDRAQELARLARQDPAQFDGLIRQFSEGPGLANEGDLGFIDLEHLPPTMYEWGQTLSRLEIGAISDPVESASGFHVLQRKDLPLRLRARQILVAWQGTPSKVIRDKAAAAAQAAGYLAQLKLSPAGELEKEFVHAVQKYSDDGGDPGGDLGTFKPQDYFPAVSQALLKTKVGELSELVETPYGYSILLRLEPLERLPEEKHPMTLPDPLRPPEPGDSQRPGTGLRPATPPKRP